MRADRSPEMSGLPALARFEGEIADPNAHGGGVLRARAVARRDTVAYGFPAVVEEFCTLDGTQAWRVLSVLLPGRVPHVVVDHRSAVGRPDVPGGPVPVSGDPAFDGEYVARGDVAVLRRILTPAVRQLLVETPVQRFALRGRTMLLRSFDADALHPDGDNRLRRLAGTLLGSAPSFIADRSWSGGPGESVPIEALPVDAEPLLPGMNGDDEEPDPKEDDRRALLLAILTLVGLGIVAVVAIVVIVVS